MNEATGSVGPLLAVGAAALVVALAWRDTRQRLELAERRVEHLREEQARLLEILREERRILEEEMQQERERHLMEVRLRDEQASREQERLEQELERQIEGREQERRARLETEARIEMLEREIESLQEAAQRAPAVPVVAGARGGRIEARDVSARTPVTRDAGRTAWPTDPPDTVSGSAREAAENRRQDQRSGRAVWHPHPDDKVSRGAAPAQRRLRRTAPVEMFRKHYDRYLENYRGYVELAEGLYRSRDGEEASNSPLWRREWEDRLRRIEDGIQRTTARLDILEEHNPELATDDRISQRANIARRHSVLL